MCLCFISVTACKHDDPIDNNKSKQDILKMTDYLETVEFLDSNISSYTYNTGGRMKFSDADSVTMTWHFLGSDTRTYSTLKGKYTLKDDFLKIEWKNVVTDSVPNTEFNTIYLSGPYEFNNLDNRIDYHYSVYDISGEKLSGPHTMMFKPHWL